MAEPGVERKLVAILAADMVGYSRLMEVDETGTIARQRAHRQELIDPKIAEHHGRIVKTTGDGLLIEFASVVDAVACAVALQRAMAEREADVPEDRRIRYRIGVNLGDIVVEGDDILGDGVNVAARLEGLAEPGGICIRREVRNQVRDKLVLAFEDMGEVEVKNLSRPIRVFRILLDGEPAASPHPSVARRSPPKQWIAAAAALLIVIAGGVLWWWQAQPDFEPADPAKMAFALPEKPSIAVLPFTNMSGDPEQEYFADGMTDDLITRISKLSGLIVISRTTSFTFKGKVRKIEDIARELGVQYVLEGSVRRAEGTVRVNAQLIDGSTGGHVWAETFDRPYRDIFALQDAVIGKIVEALAVNLTEREQQLAARKDTNSPEAFDAFLQGWAHFQRFTPADAAAAVRYFEQAIALDPDYGRAQAALAMTYWEAMESRWYQEMGLTIGEATEKAKEYLALAMKNPTALAHRLNADMLVAAGKHDAALAEAERAIAMEPSNPDGYLALAEVLVYRGEPAKALEAVGKAKRLNPENPHLYDYWGGFAVFNQERFEDAEETIRRVIELNPETPWSYMLLVAAYGHLGRKEEARIAIEHFDAIAEKRGLISLNLTLIDLWPYKKPEDKQRLRDGLRKAGVAEVPEQPETNYRLKGDELRAFALQPWWYGRDPDTGVEHWANLPGGNEIEIGGAWGSDRGTWHIEGDRLCYVWNTYGGTCSDVYRDREGTRENNDEYKIVLPIGTYPFSAYTERPPDLDGR